MNNWIEKLNYDPIEPLLSSKFVGIKYFTNRDLLKKKVGPINTIWDSPVVQKIIKKQQSTGSWKSTNQNQKKYYTVNYSLIETWKQMRFLGERYQMNKKVLAIENGVEYIFSCQKEEGDIRGFLGNQYAMFYTGAIISLLNQAGYEKDPRIEKGFQWLLANRQDDGGWLPSYIFSADLSYQEQSKLS